MNDHPVRVHEPVTYAGRHLLPCPLCKYPYPALSDDGDVYCRREGCTCTARVDDWQYCRSHPIEAQGISPDDLTEDAIRNRAKSLVLKNGWKPGDKVHLQGVVELMTQFGVEISQRPEPTRCGFPDCGCDPDARCKAALTRPDPSL